MFELGMGNKIESEKTWIGSMVISNRQLKVWVWISGKRGKREEKNGREEKRERNEGRGEEKTMRNAERDFTFLKPMTRIPLLKEEHLLKGENRRKRTEPPLVPTCAGEKIGREEENKRGKS